MRERAGDMMRTANFIICYTAWFKLINKINWLCFPQNCCCHGFSSHSPSIQFLPAPLHQYCRVPLHLLPELTNNESCLMDKIVLNFAGAANSQSYRALELFLCPLRLLKSSVGKHDNGRAVVKSIQQYSNKCHSFCKLECFSLTTWKIELKA